MKKRPFRTELVVGDEKPMVRTLQVAVGNGRFQGGVVAAGARIDDGHAPPRFAGVLEHLGHRLDDPRFNPGGHVGEVRTARGIISEIITCKPRPVNADGELVTPTPAIFSLEPRAIAVYDAKSCQMSCGEVPRPATLARIVGT